MQKLISICKLIEPLNPKSSHMVGYDKKWFNQRRINSIYIQRHTHINPNIQQANFTELELLLLQVLIGNMSKIHFLNDKEWTVRLRVNWNLTWLQTDPFFVQENRPKPALVEKSREQIIWHRHNAGCGGRFDQCQHMSTTRGTCVFDKGKKSFMLMCYWKTSSWKIALIVPAKASKLSYKSTTT